MRTNCDNCEVIKEEDELVEGPYDALICVECNKAFDKEDPYGENKLKPIHRRWA